MAYLFYTYCDQNSSTLLPYIKVTYHGNLSLQQEAYWSGKNDQYKKILSDNCLILSSSSSDTSLKDKLIEKKKMKNKRKTFDSNLNPLAVPFSIQNDEQERPLSSIENDKPPVQLVLFEPREIPSRERSCPTIHQRLYHRPRENWD